jgi:hypothetical protein
VTAVRVQQKLSEQRDLLPGFKHMHKRKPNRLAGYDYTQPGAYFITTVVNGRQNTFGEVEQGIVRLNGFGKILVEQWHWLEKHYPEIALDEFVVTPNHFHGIIAIRADRVGTGRDLTRELVRISPNRSPNW